MGEGSTVRKPWPRRAATAVGLWLATLVLLLGAASAAQAHNLPYALVDLRIAPGGKLDIALRCHLTPLIQGLPQGAPDDAAVARLTAMSDAEIAARSDEVAGRIRGMLSLRADGRLVDVAVRMPTPAQIRAEALTPRLSPTPSEPIAITAQAPAGTAVVDIALPPSLGPAVLSTRYPDGTTTTAPIPDGQRSPDLRLAGPDPVLDQVDAVLRFVRLGFGHILPGGLDHILFVVALAMGAPRLGPLVKLATTFTLAHSLTLSLAALGMVSAPAAIVEPAITLSIAVAAALSFRASSTDVGWVRLGVVFGFGLLHGLGFAGALAETGLPRGAELTALAAFNVGIELAQIAVIALVLAALRLAAPLARDPLLISRPVTACVAVAGLLWTAQRLVLEFAPATLG
ncbi:HupE/UreJ family protein [Phenylobacterium sp.]|uniref:HupE/UreJ family protein n=1 Tax=Phenylobacterium sp. TaxID=1871053 RepID=UPI0025FD024B|nr:HupE/UreJ family protein [Phenylobacterium sp.]MBX3484696.1 HupE/UreJ family protein [Phenylobacterium sp.]MCW5759681.1 HupE/UreJ family protein [Phenylobacterium sp.]